MEPDFASIRLAGQRAAAEAIGRHAPMDPLERVAWAAGFDREGRELIDAIVEAKEVDRTWREIADASGLPLRTVISRGTRARKQADPQR